MRRKEALQGVRVIKFRSVLDRYESRDLNQIEAAELLGITERTFRRWCHRYEEAGDAGLLDRRLRGGRASGARLTENRRSKPCIGRATAVSPPAISTNTLCASTSSVGATPGPSCFCSRRVCWCGPRRVARTVASARGGRSRG